MDPISQTKIQTKNKLNYKSKTIYMYFFILLGLLIWGVVYAILGDTAAPGGALFGLAALTVAAHFGGWLISLTTLPALIGMLVVGIIFQVGNRQ